MRLLSIQVGQPRMVPWRGNSTSTAIFKAPVSGPVWVRRLNIEGDRQADLRVHGGADKAVYAYSADAYPWWRKELSVADLPYGAFGENLTFDALDESRLCLGDDLAIGECRLQVVQPRLPCFKLGIKFGSQRILKTFMRSGRPGIYFRVLAEGRIQAGDEAAVARKDPQTVPLLSLFELAAGKALAPDLLRRALRVESLEPGWREMLEQALA